MHRLGITLPYGLNYTANLILWIICLDKTEHKWLKIAKRKWQVHKGIYKTIDIKLN